MHVEQYIFQFILTGLLADKFVSQVSTRSFLQKVFERISAQSTGAIFLTICLGLTKATVSVALVASINS